MALVVFWVLAIEADLLPMLIEHAVVRRASERGGALRSIWFVDLDAEHERQMESLRAATRDHPSLH